ncbi:ribonuclease H-like protein [Hirsutella rhossiliensis]
MGGVSHAALQMQTVAPPHSTLLYQSQRKESGHGTTLHWAFNNATRWNSDMQPVETEGLCDRTKPAVLQYRLSAYDWKVIGVLVKLLKPFEIANKQLQGSGVPGGSSDQEKKDVELGWKKLHKYYSRLTSAAYVVAVVFNPAKSGAFSINSKLLEIWEKYRERDVDNEILATSDEASMDYIERRLARTVADETVYGGSDW